MPPDPALRIEVCQALPGSATRIEVDVDDGATLGEALERSGIVALRSLDPASLSFAIFGRRARSSTVLRDGDRIELLRPLIVDPMEARRRRAVKKQGAPRDEVDRDR